MRRTNYLVQEKLDVLCRVNAACAALYTQELKYSSTRELERRNTSYIQRKHGTEHQVFFCIKYLIRLILILINHFAS
jgi:hypothetical protein